MTINEAAFSITCEDTADISAKMFHEEDRLRIFLNLGETLSFHTGSETFLLIHNHFLVLKKETAYTLLPAPHASCIFLSVDASFLNASLLPPEASSTLTSLAGAAQPLSDENTSTIVDLCRKLFFSAQTNACAYQTFRDSWICEILMNLYSSMAAQTAPAPSGTDTIQSVLLYLEENYTDKIEIDSLASRFYISKYHLMRVFKRETGMTIHTFIQNKRIQHACRLMSAGIKPSEACYRSGFSDYSLFFKAFTKTTGSAPSHYANV